MRTVDPGLFYSLDAHAGDGVQSRVPCCYEVALVLSHFDGVQPVADGNEDRIVRQVFWGFG